MGELGTAGLVRGKVRTLVSMEGTIHSRTVGTLQSRSLLTCQGFHELGGEGLGAAHTSSGQQSRGGPGSARSQGEVHTLNIS